MNRKIMFAISLTAAGALSGAALAQGNSGNNSMMSTASANAATVSFCGTVQRVDPHSCLLVNPSEPIGTAYDITGAKPVPKIGEMIAGTGTSNGTSTCGNATRLTKVKWHGPAICPLGGKK